MKHLFYILQCPSLVWIFPRVWPANMPWHVACQGTLFLKDGGHLFKVPKIPHPLDTSPGSRGQTSVFFLATFWGQGNVECFFFLMGVWWMTKWSNEVSHVFFFSHCGVLYIICWPKDFELFEGKLRLCFTSLFSRSIPKFILSQIRISEVSRLARFTIKQSRFKADFC